MATERESAVLWLPGAFVLEVLAWEVGSRLGLAMVDPGWEEFGRNIQVERITWGLGGAVLVLLAAFLVLCKGGSKTAVSCVQLLGILALAAYWVGASVLASGAVVALATIAAVVLGRRRVG
ncbi:MAG: hypothetical protein KUG77_07795 [Nannocystaceae bacterium]|nr:hypothetical protein [Nannocystaceae bacterium]